MFFPKTLLTMVLLAIVFSLAVPSASASTISFGSAPTSTTGGGVGTSPCAPPGNICGNSNIGNSGTWTADDLSFTATAYAFTLLAPINLSSTFVESALQWFGAPGLGVCNSNEIAGGDCDIASGLEWQVDSGGSRDFVLYVFDTPVVVSSLTVNQTNPAAIDSDVTYWLFTSITEPDLIEGDTLPAGGTDNPGPDLMGTRTFSIGGPPTPVRAILLSPRDGNDVIKPYALAGTAVPEPASMALVGIGLAGLGLVARRRKQKR